MCWLWLFLAIALEVAATVCLKLSNGFSRLVPTALMALFYGSSFLPTALALRKMEIATLYAVWSALGTAMVTIIGVLVFKESASPLKIGALILIVIGVVCLNVSARETAPAKREARTPRQRGAVVAFKPSANVRTAVTPRHAMPVRESGVRAVSLGNSVGR